MTVGRFRVGRSRLPNTNLDTRFPRFAFTPIHEPQNWPTVWGLELSRLPIIWYSHKINTSPTARWKTAASPRAGPYP